MHRSKSIKIIEFHNANDPNRFAKYLIKVLGEEIGKQVNSLSKENNSLEHILENVIEKDNANDTDKL